MKLYIPEIGDILTLSKDWSFTLYQESRNFDLIEVIGEKAEYPKWIQGRAKMKEYPVTLEKGTQLKVDRIYIRKGAQDFSSITFRIDSSPTYKKKIRFWAKLTDVNTIEFDEVKPIGKILKIDFHRDWEERYQSYSECMFNDLQNYEGHYIPEKITKVPVIYGYVNGDKRAEIEFVYTLRLLDEKEQKDINRNRYGRSPHCQSVDRKVETFTMKAVDIKTKDVIASAKTKETLKKKLAEYYQK